jgi:ABC-2 type transport system ATP-binding protein
MPSGVPAIEASGITRHYGERKALDEFSLTVPTGSVFGLLGPNGSGKSTFISLVAAMEKPAAGTLRVLGGEPTTATRRRIATVFQENALDPLMSVGESLRLAGRLFGLSGGAVKQRIPALLAQFGLEDRLRDSTAALSGGMRRRLEMARALLHDPELLLLDEPTTGVDPEERRALWAALMDRRGGRTVLLATNDLAEADTVCEYVAFMQAGRVVASGTPAELKRGLRRESLRLTWPHATDAQLAEVQSWPGAGRVARDGDTVHITVDDASAFVPRLFATAGNDIRGVNIETSSLEDAYFQHVTRRITGEPAAVAQ